MSRPVVTQLSEVQDDKYYRFADLQAILSTLGLNYSIYTIRDYETWKCLNYKCYRRHNEKVDVCPHCGGKVREPIIKSPRTLGGGKGVGHRRYLGSEMKEIVEIIKQRR